MRSIYLDYAATTPVKKEIFEFIKPMFTENFGNPSSIHEKGRFAREAIDSSREIIAKFLNADPSEIIFTSGGTEADNLAVRGVINALRNMPSLACLKATALPHIITAQIEHHAIINTCKALEKEGLAEVTYLKPDSEGIISTEKVKSAIKKNTVLVSIMYVNNEVGTVQPIREIGKMIERINELRMKNEELKHKIYFHTDAVQATGYQNMDVDFLHVVLLTISSHKIGAPKGTGVLFIKKGTPIKKILFGGEQELNMRAGTENVAGIAALGKAIEELKIQNAEFRIKKIQKLRDYFIDKILKEIPKVTLNGSRENRSPNNINFYFQGVEGESILLNLDLAGIAASSGSACTSASLQPSHVLMALYDEAERAHGSIRFTIGGETTKEELDYTIKKLKEIIKKLRVMSPLWLK
jgi:cysteine desulfurase